MKQFILTIDSSDLKKEQTSKNGSIYAIFCRILVDGVEIDKINYYCPIVNTNHMDDSIDAYLTHGNYFDMLKDFIRFYNRHKLYIGDINFELDNYLENVYLEQIWSDAFDLGLFKGDKYHRVNLSGFGVPLRFLNTGEWVTWFHAIKNKQIEGAMLEYITDCKNKVVYQAKEII